MSIAGNDIMNRVAKALILSVAALTTVASTIEFASAGDRHWRRHHVVKPWKKRVIVTGVVAGAVVVSRPRIIYREEPIIEEEVPFYDEDSIYDDDDLHVGPGVEDRRRLYRDDVPEDDDFAAPSEGDGDDIIYDDQRSAEYDEEYFPDEPQVQIRKERNDAAQFEERAEAPRKHKADSDKPREEANVEALKPWSSEWRQRCAKRFPSFNPQNGTYLGYDKKRRFCKAA
jgi:hypothetical protein